MNSDKISLVNFKRTLSNYKNMSYISGKPFEHSPWMQEMWGPINLSEGFVSAGYIGESRLIDVISPNHEKIALICEHPCTRNKTTIRIDYQIN